MARVVAVTFCVTLSASLAARLGSIPMAAFQTCLQVWMTSSLLADGLAVAVQVQKHFFFLSLGCTIYVTYLVSETIVSDFTYLSAEHILAHGSFPLGYYGCKQKKNTDSLLKLFFEQE